MTGIPRWVEPYLAIPFKDRGRTADGCDCYGLVRLIVARRAGILLPDYGLVASRDRVSVNEAIVHAKADRAVWRAVPIQCALALDLVPMTEVARLQSGVSDVVDCHIGIMVTPRHVLHTERASGPACVDISHPSVLHRFHPQDAPLIYRHRDICK